LTSLPPPSFSILTKEDVVRSHLFFQGYTVCADQQVVTLDGKTTLGKLMGSNVVALENGTFELHLKIELTKQEAEHGNASDKGSAEVGTTDSSSGRNGAEVKT
jgi:hypothetical protein